MKSKMAIDKETNLIFDEVGSILLTDDTFDRFFADCKAGETPNQKLQEALVFSKELGIR